MKDIAAYLDTEFEKNLFQACLKNLDDKENPLRVSNFSFAFRELIEAHLKRIADDSEIRQCAWWKTENAKASAEDKDKVFRGHRLHYALHKGIEPAYVKAELKLDVDEVVQETQKVIKTLNSYTHVSEKTFGQSLEEQEIVLDEVAGCFIQLFKLISDFNDDLIQALAEDIDGVATNALSEVDPDLDMLATHYWVDEVSVGDHSVKKIDAKFILVEASGTVGVVHQYGSDSDFKKDIGARTSASYPFSAEIKFLSSNPHKIAEDGISFSVDTSKFYE